MGLEIPEDLINYLAQGSYFHVMSPWEQRTWGVKDCTALMMKCEVVGKTAWCLGHKLVFGHHCHMTWAQVLWRGRMQAEKKEPVPGREGLGSIRNTVFITKDKSASQVGVEWWLPFCMKCLVTVSTQGCGGCDATLAPQRLASGAQRKPHILSGGTGLLLTWDGFRGC